MSLLERASGLLEPDDPRRLALLPPLGQALYLLGRLDDAYRTFDAASERADPDTAARAYFMKTAVRGHGESISPYEIERDVRAGLARVEGSASDGTLAAGYNLLGWALYWSGRLEAATEQAQRAIALARLAGDRPLELAAIRLDAARVLHGDVPWREAEVQARELAAQGLDTGMLQGIAAGMQGRVEEARRLSDDYRRNEREHGRLINVYIGVIWRSMIELAEGDLDRAIELRARAGTGSASSASGGSAPRSAATSGRCSRGAESSRRRKRSSTRGWSLSTPDDWVTVSQVLTGRGFVASGRGDHESACELGREAVELVDSREYLTMQQEIRLAYAELLAAAGRNGEARTAFIRAREVAERKGSTLLVDRVIRLVGELDS